MGVVILVYITILFFLSNFHKSVFIVICFIKRVKMLQHLTMTNAFVRMEQAIKISYKHLIYSIKVLEYYEIEIDRYIFNILFKRLTGARYLVYCIAIPSPSILYLVTFKKI